MFQHNQKNKIFFFNIFDELRDKISIVLSSELDYEKILTLNMFDGCYLEDSQVKKYFIDHFVIFLVNHHYLTGKELYTNMADQKRIMEQYNSILDQIPFIKSILNKLKKVRDLEIFLKKHFDDEFFNQYITKIPELYEKNILKINRKKLGLYSTPKYIAEYIIDQIFILNFKETRPTELKILDNSCGLGNFLVTVGDYFSNKKGYRSVCDMKFYGGDINEVALQIFLLQFFKRNLLSERTTLRVFYNDTLTMKFNSKFDIIIGNPPYYIIAKRPRNMIRNRKRLKRSHKTYISKRRLEDYLKFDSSQVKQINIFNLFIEKAIRDLKDGGYLGYIIPDILLTGNTSKKIRRFILNTCKIIQIVKIKDIVFSDGGVSNIIIIIQKEGNKIKRNKNKIKVIDTETSVLKEKIPKRFHYIDQNIFNLLPNHNFSIDIKPEDWKELIIIQNKLKNNKLIPLGKIAKIGRGMEIGKSSEKIFSFDEIKDNERLKNNENLVKVISIDNISRYYIDYDDENFPNKVIVYDPDNKRIYKRREMYIKEKIVLKRVARELIAAIDVENKYFCLDSIQIINLRNNSDYSLYYLLGVLNSAFLNKYYQLIYGNYKKLFTRVNKGYLVRLPIPKVSKNDQKQVEQLVKQILRKKPEEKSAKIKNEINNIVYRHFFLSMNC
ncbi:MAG: N-6 DNA methylase [Candidatus Lokiarchaeota archaeon]|nr:N-6 DNA methylase [Candidatus Lokiarchaeota archaeon]